MLRITNDLDPQNAPLDDDIDDDEIERRESSIEDQKINYHELRDEMEYLCE